MNTKTKLSALMLSTLIFSVLTITFVSFDVPAASAADLTASWDLHVVAGMNTASPSLPAADTPPAGFNFAVADGGQVTGYSGSGPGPVPAQGGFDFGSVGRRFEGWILTKGWVRVDITNQLGYDIVVTDLIAKITDGTEGDAFLHPYGYAECMDPNIGNGTHEECVLNWTYANHTLVYFDAGDPYNDEIDYVAQSMTPVYDAFEYTDSVCTNYTISGGALGPTMLPIGENDSDPGRMSLMEPDLGGDAFATGHVPPVILADDAVLDEYFGINIGIGNITDGSPIYGTIELTLHYQMALTPEFSILSIDPLYDAGYPQWNVAISPFNVTVKNVGSVTLDFDVALQYVNDTTYFAYWGDQPPLWSFHHELIEIGSQSVNLGAGAETTLTYNVGLQFSDFPLGRNRTLIAIATAPGPNASSIYIDVLTVGAFHVKMNGDVDGDYDVDSTDVFANVALAYGKIYPDPAYKVQCDFDHDGDVDSSDVFSYLALNYGKTY